MDGQGHNLSSEGDSAVEKYILTLKILIVVLEVYKKHNS
jgi:hypothetical protein